MILPGEGESGYYPPPPFTIRRITRFETRSSLAGIALAARPLYNPPLHEYSSRPGGEIGRHWRLKIS